MTDAELATEVRTELGKLPASNTEDIVDADIVREAGHILERINSRITKKVLRSVTSTATNQRDFDVNAATLRVQEVLTSDEVEELKLKLGSYIIREEVGSSEDYNFPSLWYIRSARRKRALPKLWFEFIPIEKKLKIDPPAEEIGSVYWYVSVESAGWTLSNTPTEFKEIVISGTVWKCLQTVALRRSTEGGIERGGGRVGFPAESLFRMAEKFKEDFFAELELKVKLYSL